MIRIHPHLQQLLLALIVGIVLSGCGPPYETDTEKLFGGSPPYSAAYKVGERTIHYVEVGDRGRPVVIFLHGTPGSWRAFASFWADKTLDRSLKMIAVDRPGFGMSDHGDLVLSLATQAALLSPLLEQPGNCPVILVGHSLGAPLAVQLAMDYPGRVAALLLVAPSLDPELEAPRWYNRLTTSPLIKWAVPANLLLANQEVMALEPQLREMKPRWASLKLPVTIIQGDDDRLVDPANVDYAERMLGKHLKTVRVPGEGHFILWERPELIKRELLELVKKRLSISRLESCVH